MSRGGGSCHGGILQNPVCFGVCRVCVCVCVRARVCVCVCVKPCYQGSSSYINSAACEQSRGLECMTRVSSQRRRSCACSANVPADQFLGAECTAGLVKEIRAPFRFPKQGFQAVMSATVHVKHVQLHTSCGASCHVQFTNKMKIQALSPDDEVPRPPVKDFMSLGRRVLLDR